MTTAQASRALATWRGRSEARKTRRAWPSQRRPRDRDRLKSGFRGGLCEVHRLRIDIWDETAPGDRWMWPKLRYQRADWEGTRWRTLWLYVGPFTFALVVLTSRLSEPIAGNAVRLVREGGFREIETVLAYRDGRHYRLWLVADRMAFERRQSLYERLYDYTAQCPGTILCHIAQRYGAPLERCVPAKALSDIRWEPW